MKRIYEATDAEGDTLAVLDTGDTLLFMRNDEEGQTVELTREDVTRLRKALFWWEDES